MDEAGELQSQAIEHVAVEGEPVAP
jgi:hypothetical protein